MLDYHLIPRVLPLLLCPLISKSRVLQFCQRRLKAFVIWALDRPCRSYHLPKIIKLRSIPMQWKSAQGVQRTSIIQLNRVRLEDKLTRLYITVLLRQHQHSEQLSSSTNQPLICTVWSQSQRLASLGTSSTACLSFCANHKILMWLSRSFHHRLVARLHT